MGKSHGQLALTLSEFDTAGNSAVIYVMMQQRVLKFCRVKTQYREWAVGPLY